MAVNIEHHKSPRRGLLNFQTHFSGKICLFFFLQNLPIFMLLNPFLTTFKCHIFIQRLHLRILVLKYT